MRLNKFFVGQIILVIYVVAIMLLINNTLNIGLIITGLNSLLLLFWVKWISGNYSNVTVLFTFFSMLYGLSGPINVVWGEGLHMIFSYSYATEEFLVSYSLAKIGIILGIIFFCLIKKDNGIYNHNMSSIASHIFDKRDRLINIAIGFSSIASIFEVINLIRAGGVGLLFSGKATFQSQVSELTLTLPSTIIMIIGFSLIGISISVMNDKKNTSLKIRTKIVLFILTSIPFLILKMMLGQRGILLSFIICLIIGVTYFKPIKRIKFKLIVLVLIIYVFFAFIYANRGIVYLIQDNPSQFIDMAFQKERVVNALNPGGNEFGAAFGNYSAYYKKHGTDFSPKMGSTYFKGLLLPIPSFVYPGQKPKQITYEFRDEMFPSEASRGRIAGTGFSSILEAYMNFKYFGVIFIYFMIGYLLQKIDKYYKFKSLYFALLYISSTSQAVNFHRSALGTIFSNIFIRALILIPVILYIDFKFKKTSKIQRYNN